MINPPLDDNGRPLTCPSCDAVLTYLPRWNVYGCVCLWGHEPSADEVVDMIDLIDTATRQ